MTDSISEKPLSYRRLRAESPACGELFRLLLTNGTHRALYLDRTSKEQITLTLTTPIPVSPHRLTETGERKKHETNERSLHIDCGNGLRSSRWCHYRCHIRKEALLPQPFPHS